MLLEVEMWGKAPQTAIFFRLKSKFLLYSAFFYCNIYFVRDNWGNSIMHDLQIGENVQNPHLIFVTILFSSNI